MKILEKEDEKMLSRTRVSAEAVFGAAVPSKNDVRAKIASLLKSQDSLVVINKIGTNFGSRKAIVDAYAYKDEKSLKSAEVIPRKVRRAEKEAAKKAAAEKKE
ncbi:hypothetical protein J4212_06690 [Candidatus Woesearchaeota archaeon]|nr:hypothetical protein [Candidatus Woesearchaeota archaeon]